MLDRVGELMYNTPVMLQEIKSFLKGNLTKSLQANVISDDGSNQEITYELTNNALNVRFNVVRAVGFVTVMMVWTQNTNETLAIRADGSHDWEFYAQVHNQKDIKDILNIIKTKFFPNV